ncbi:MAG: hypothetical protein A2Z91_03330 [Deltaproteobacteria bacterium GWA2_38_16]|nr:MAG: hypothetical protein A2Z91_03330 [Deltaproteobacteria bacterium GWA2_38_16]OGQ02917.1 MAG: hypothetical protein A3D19_06760 [Deltaproteobacteria bacterium RIFCSPHIGHO2_02_FULL_38_15]OGQ35071.1 MAG: hypothetical protein A3A72_03415 [Deltaproteobacteria bacterium RIFCSPLOWO2_01_FULL_38_9]HBQ21765.1 hypothetical protein [Deltaproteobacteria bacterium]
MIFDSYFDDKYHEVKIVEDKHGYLITIDQDESFHIDVMDRLTGGYSLLHKGRSFEFDVESKDSHYTILSRGNLFNLEIINRKSAALRSKESEEKKITAKMPGKIIKVLAKVGDPVTKGQGLIIMEAMKMENELKAPISGKVKSIHVQEGKTVDSGADLLLIE